MRKTVLPSLLLLAAAPCLAQEPPRRAEELRALRARLEAQALSARSLESQRALLELQRATMFADAERPKETVELLRALEAQTRALASLQSDREALEAQRADVATRARLAEARRALIEGALDDAAGDVLFPGAGFVALLDDIAERGMPEAWASQDPADSLYRAGREQLNAGRYGAAARTFARIRTEARFARSQYRPAAFYWEAFALSRTGSTADLRRAREILTALEHTYGPDERPSDASELATAIEARLARSGDEAARAGLARAVEAATVTATNLATAEENAARVRVNAARESDRAAHALSANVTVAGRQCPEDDIRTVALNALLQMDSEQALPLLREVMERRDECSVHLRRRAMMMLAERRDPAAQSILIEAALSDPDPEVREQATFWLSHVPGDAAVDALARILGENPTPAVRARAIFALSQQQGERAAEILREYALRDDVPDDLRRHIVFALAHSSSDADATFLRDLYARTEDHTIKQQIVMTLSQDPSPEVADWILGLATDPNEPVEVRRHALLMTANTPGIDSERLIRLYDDTRDADMRRHILLVLAQRVHDDPAVVGKLVEIARTTDDADLQRTIVYMLSESRDPRALALMAELVRR